MPHRPTRIIVILQAAVLHDTIEDTETTPAELEARFGPVARRLAFTPSPDAADTLIDASPPCWSAAASARRAHHNHPHELEVHMRAVRLAVVMLVASTAIAAAQTTPTIYVHSGGAVPMGPSEFADYYGVGFNFGGAIDFDVTETVAFQPSFLYANFRVDEDALLSDAGVSGSGVSIDGGAASGLFIAGNVKARIPVQNSAASPYLLAGLGFFRVSTSDITVSGPGGSVAIDGGDPENAFGINFGGGLNVAVSPSMGLFGEIDYVLGFTEDESTTALPIKLGFSFRPGRR